MVNVNNAITISVLKYKGFSIVAQFLQFLFTKNNQFNASSLDATYSTTIKDLNYSITIEAIIYLFHSVRQSNKKLN